MNRVTLDPETVRGEASRRSDWRGNRVMGPGICGIAGVRAHRVSGAGCSEVDAEDCPVVPDLVLGPSVVRGRGR